MAVHGLSYAKEDWFVCGDDPGKRDTLEESKSAGATIFYHRAIPNAVMTEIQDDQSTQTIRAVATGSGTMEQVVNQRSSKRNRDCFRYGVKRWENFPDENDAPIPLTFEKEMRAGKLYDVVSEDSMNQLHLATVNEVGAELFHRNSMDDSKRKKFEAAWSELGGSNLGIADNAANSSNTNEDADGTQESDGTKTSKKSSKGKKSKTPTPSIVTSDGSAPSLNNLSGQTR